MIIAQISDTHIALDTPDADLRIRDFERTIADINSLDPAPDVIVHSGDIVHNGRQDEYACAVAILSAARAPVYVMAGNKDDRANLRAAFSDEGYLAPDSDFIDYAVEAFPVRLVLLDTLSTTSNKGDFCAERLRRLQTLLDAETTRPIAVFTHHPPFEVFVGPDRIHFATLEAMTALRAALQQCDRIVGIFSGHVHRATTGQVGSIPASVMQATATSLRRGEYPEHMATRPIYHLHRYEPGVGFITETRIATSPGFSAAS